jgi:hypothetical protein
LFYKALRPLEKQSRRGFRGYPVATIAFYGADAERATKVAVGIIPAEDADETHAVKSVVLVDRIIGRPHQEGLDDPEGVACPQCPFWANRDRSPATHPKRSASWNYA